MARWTSQIFCDRIWPIAFGICVIHFIRFLAATNGTLPLLAGVNTIRR
ncbi:MAG: hypothetical protein F6K10_32785 [Moorea sp. SIO2B7]|nr:hypothetical protein [Moorena sp. SIO2B7]